MMGSFWNPNWYNLFPWNIKNIKMVTIEMEYKTAPSLPCVQRNIVMVFKITQKLQRY